MAELKWSELASADLMAIADYISDDNPDAALSVVNQIAEKATNLQHFPKLGRVGRVNGTRELIVMNYILVYSLGPNFVKILRVLHGSQSWPT